MTTYYRPRYAESDAVWAELHAELPPAPGDTREHCPQHGPYTATGAHDHQCPTCAADYDAATDTARTEAVRRWAAKVVGP